MTHLLDRLPLQVKRELFKAEGLISATKDCNDPRLLELAWSQLHKATTELLKFNSNVTGIMILCGLQVLQTKLVCDSGKSYDLSNSPFEELN
ncbi:MAG: hypothetical protein MUC92_02750 [Fimbriimonadaceae bacterium]|jgi:hypothetical protein|nr:hypothetical protein [Fimbriimonadaceae bacterium]